MASVPLISIYVSDLERSMDFYEYVFECSISELTNGFAILAITDNVAITLAQALRNVREGDSIGGGVEISFSVGSYSNVEKLYSKFKNANTQTPSKIVDNEFGVAFVGIDPDGHRLRICCPPKPNSTISFPNCD